MNTKTIFNSLAPNLKEILNKIGITDLYPPQAEAIKNGILHEQNFILSMPTASGKTLLAELCMLEKLLKKEGNCLYIVPLRALASEKFEDFKKKYSYLGIKIGIATGDFDYVDPNLVSYDILIATAEKVDSLLRQKPTWLCAQLTCVIADEIHYIGDAKRGPTLETIITKLVSIKPKLKIIGLSATIANALSIAKWLNARLISSDWRPVPLKEGVYCQGEIKFSDGSLKQLSFGKTNDEIAALTLDCIDEKGQVLIFLNTRKSAQAEARRVAKEIHSGQKHIEFEKLKALAEELQKKDQETTKLSHQLSECIKYGVAFHHAGLDFEHRKLVEDNFRQNLIKVICATPTLAVGVNLPSRRTIIRGLYRYESGVGMKPISVLEYKQMSGRAGRPQYDKYGEAILFARTAKEQEELFNDFIFADTEPVRSYLGTENALRVHLLASIVTNFISSLDGAFSFLSKTFFAQEEKYYDLSEMVKEIITFLEKEEMIKRRQNTLLPTAFGTRISRLYIDPISAVIIRDCLKMSSANVHPLSILYLVCALPDMSLLALNRSDLEKVIPFMDMHKEQFTLPLPLSEDYSIHLARIKTVWMLSKWMDEEKEDIICDFFGVGPGDIHRFLETVDWLLYSTAELSRLFKTHFLKSIQDLKIQIRYGIKSELLELVGLKGVGRIRARNLYNKGYKNLSQLKTASLERLQKIPAIGKELALSIKNQVSSLS